MKKYLLDFLNGLTVETCEWNKLPEDLPIEMKQKMIKMIQLGLIPTNIQLYDVVVSQEIIDKTEPTMIEHFKQFDSCWQDYYFPYIGFYIKKEHYECFTKVIEPQKEKYFCVTKKQNSTAIEVNFSRFYDYKNYPFTLYDQIYLMHYAFYLCGNPKNRCHTDKAKVIDIHKKTEPYTVLKNILSNEEYYYVEIFNMNRNNSLFDNVTKFYIEAVELYEKDKERGSKSFFSNLFNFV